MTTNNSNYWVVHFMGIPSTTNIKSNPLQELFWNFLPQALHTSIDDRQLQRIWIILSPSRPQIRQQVSLTLTFFNKFFFFFFVSQRLWHALHINILAAFGIFKFQINLQIPFPPDRLDPSRLNKSCLSFPCDMHSTQWTCMWCSLSKSCHLVDCDSSIVACKWSSPHLL